MYHKVLLDQVAKPHRMKAMADANGTGQVGFPGEGAFMIIYLKQGEQRRIDQAGFETYGCPAAIGCGSWLTWWVEGKTVEEVADITPEDLMIALGGLPLGKEQCAFMAVDALRCATRELPK